MQDADSSQSPVLPAGLPCMVSASLSSLASSDVLLHSVRLEGSSADTGNLLPGPDNNHPGHGQQLCRCARFKSGRKHCRESVDRHGELLAETEQTYVAVSGGAELLHCSSAVSESQPVLFRKGDVQTVLGTVLCKQPSSAMSPATLSVTWQRSRCITVLFPAASLWLLQCIINNSQLLCRLRA